MNKLWFLIPPTLLAMAMYWQHTRIETLTEQLAIERVANQQLTQSIDNIDKEMTKFKADIEETNHAFDEYRSEVDELGRVFAESSLYNALQGKSSLVIKRINKASDALWDELEREINSIGEDSE